MAVSCQPPLREAADVFSTKVLWGEDIFPISSSKTEWIGYHGRDGKYSPKVYKFMEKVVGMGGSGVLVKGGNVVWKTPSVHAVLTLRSQQQDSPQRKFCPSPTAECVGMQAQGILIELPIRD
jgi:hypothetical protein